MPTRFNGHETQQKIAPKAAPSWQRMVRHDKQRLPFFPIDDENPRTATAAREAMRTYQRSADHVDTTVFAVNFGTVHGYTVA